MKGESKNSTRPTEEERSMGKSGLLSKSGLDLFTTEPTSNRRSDYIKYSRKTSSEGIRSSEIGHISKFSNGSREWRVGSTLCIGWITWSTTGTKS